MVLKNAAKAAATAGLALAMTVGGVAPAFAATDPADDTPAGYTYAETGSAPKGAGAATASGSGVVSGTKVQFGTLDSAQTSAGTKNKEGVHITYSTVGGLWTDSGDDKTAGSTDNHDYVNGTFQVTVPKEIKYEHMRIGAVSTSDEYDVFARGVIGIGKTLTVSAAGTALTNATQAETDSTNIHAAVSSAKADATVDPKDVPVGAQTFSEAGYSVAYSANELFGSTDGSLNDDGGLKGTTTRDTIKLTGNVMSEGTWEGNVTYTATLA